MRSRPAISLKRHDASEGGRRVANFAVVAGCARRAATQIRRTGDRRAATPHQQEMTMSGQPSVTLNDGVEMPQFGLGVWQTPPDQAAQVVRTAVEAGYRAVDTAAIYGNEKGVGEGLRAAGDGGVFLTTKLWNEHQG